MSSEIPYDCADEDTLGGRISFGRETAGFSVEDAATRLGVLTESWDAWERDRDVPRGSRLTMMAGLLGVSPSWLLTGSGAGPVERFQESSTEDLMRAFRQTSEEVAVLNRRMQEIADSLARQSADETSAAA